MTEQSKTRRPPRLPPPGKDLESQYPGVAAEWDYERNGDLLPSQVFAHSHIEAWWKCRNCGQSWPAKIYVRSEGRGCPFDAGKLPIVGKTDLATLRPDLAEEWDYERNGKLTPIMVTVSSNKHVWWKCKKCNQNWPGIISNRTTGHGCPYCAGKLAIPGKTDLATLRPDLAEEWDYERNGKLTPIMVTISSGKNVWWKCKSCGQSWPAKVGDRTHGHGCPFDAGRLPIPYKTDLGTLRPDLAEEWDYERNGKLTPIMVTVSSNKQVWWKCKTCGRSWASVIYSRSAGAGCTHSTKHTKQKNNKPK